MNTENPPSPPSVETNSLASILTSQVCAICGDKPAGKHFGVYACDACTAFFRRNIQNNNTRNQRCQVREDCVMDKSNRKRCGACRMKKCLQVGMRPECVQNAREPNGPRAQKQTNQPEMMMMTQPDGNNSTLILAALLKAEMDCREDRPKLDDSAKIANLKDIFSSIEKHAPALTKWAGLIPTLAQLSPNDQVTLFNAHLPEKWILDLVIRSLPLNDVLLLSNGLIIPKNSDASTESPEITRIYTRIFNDIFEPLKELNLDDNQFACLKAITFFNPSVAGLDSQDMVKKLRFQVHTCLEDYISQKQDNQNGSFGEILFIVLSMQSIITELLVQLPALPKLEIVNLQPVTVINYYFDPKVVDNINIQSTSSSS